MLLCLYVIYVVKDTKPNVTFKLQYKDHTSNCPLLQQLWLIVYAPHKHIMRSHSADTTNTIYNKTLTHDRIREAHTHASA